MGLKLLYTSFGVSITLIILGIISISLSDLIIKKMVTSGVNLVPGSQLYTQWKDPPIDVFISFYLYDLKNGEEFTNGATPDFIEQGPFIFQEFVRKDNLVDNGNGTLTYNERKVYYFREDMSGQDLSLEIQSLNMAAITVADKIKFSNYLIVKAVDLALKATGENLLIKKTIFEILFGYEDKLLSYLKPLNLVPTDIIGFFIGKNNTQDGLYTVNDGKADYTQVGKVESFNKEAELNIWGSKQANMLNGTDGTLLPPLLKKGGRIYIFENDLCRSVYADYDHEITIIDDIYLLGFTPTRYFYSNYTVNPDNAAFCTPPGNCLPEGLLNLTTCPQFLGAPIIMSLPHFLYSSDKVQSDSGLSPPNFNVHGTFIYAEPLSGLLMKANKRIQFNTMLRKDSRIGIFENVPEVLFPLFWIDEHFTIDKKNADKYKNQVKIPLLVLNISKWIIFGSGVLLLLVTFFYAYYLKDQLKDRFNKKNSTNEQLIVNEEKGLNGVSNVSFNATATSSDLEVSGRMSPVE